MFGDFRYTASPRPPYPSPDGLIYFVSGGGYPFGWYTVSEGMSFNRVSYKIPNLILDLGIYTVVYAVVVYPRKLIQSIRSYVHLPS